MDRLLMEWPYAINVTHVLALTQPIFTRGREKTTPLIEKKEGAEGGEKNYERD